MRQWKRWSDMRKSDKPRIAGYPQKLEKAGKWISLRLSRGSNP